LRQLSQQFAQLFEHLNPKLLLYLYFWVLCWLKQSRNYSKEKLITYVPTHFGHPVVVAKAVVGAQKSM